MSSSRDTADNPKQPQSPTQLSSSDQLSFSFSSPLAGTAAVDPPNPAPVPSMPLRSNSLPDLPSSLPSSPPHDPLVSSDDTALSVLTSTAPTAPLTSHQRQLARNALLLGLSKASSLRSSSTVVRFSLDTMNSLVPGTARRMAVGGWMEYGEPMLKRIDERLDEAVNAIANATSGLQHVYAYNPNTAATSRASQHMEHEPSSASSQSSSASSISIDDSSSSSHQLVPISSASSPTASTLYAAYWERLKSKFISSHWYTKVDHILLQNSLVHAFTHHLLHPAEVFFATVTEEFLASQQSQEEFLASLQQRVGPAWDERLAPLAKGFYTTAKAVSAMVGAGRFVGGVMQLGKMRVDGVMEDLLKQWDRVLGLGDDMMDRYLPEVEGSEEMRRIESGRMDEEQGEEDAEEKGEKQSNRGENQAGHPDRWQCHSSNSLATTEDDAVSVPSTVSSPYLSRTMDNEGPRLRRSGKKRSSEHLDRYEQDDHESVYSDDSDEAEDDHSDSYNQLSSSLTLPPLSSHPDRTGQVLITKFGKRLRQRIPSALSLHTSSSFLSPLSLASFSTDLKQRLMESSWFTLVDDILMQNALVKALAAFVRPAEHFFQTSLQLWSSQRVEDMKRLEAAADDGEEDVQGVEEEVEEVGERRMDDERTIEANMEEVEQAKAGAVAEGRTEQDGSRVMQLDNSSPRAPAPPPTVPTFSASLFTTVNPAASFTSSPLPSTHINHSPVSRTSTTQVSTATLPTSSYMRPASTVSHWQSSFTTPQHESASSSTFLPRIIPPSPSSFLSTSSLSPTSSLPSDPVFDDFAFHLRERLGGSWDDRLYQPTRSFYQTAQSIRPKPTA